MCNLITRREAADLLRISLVTLDKLRAEGQLAYIQRTAMARVFFRMDDIEAYLTRTHHPARPRPAAPRPRTRRNFRKWGV